MFLPCFLLPSWGGNLCHIKSILYVHRVEKYFRKLQFDSYATGLLGDFEV